MYADANDHNPSDQELTETESENFSANDEQMYEEVDRIFEKEDNKYYEIYE